MRRPSKKTSRDLEFLSDLRARGVSEVEFEYGKSGRQRIRRVTFSETSPEDIRRALEAVETNRLEELTRGMDPEDRKRVEARLRDATFYHSS